MTDQSKFMKAIHWFERLEINHNTWAGPHLAKHGVFGKEIILALRIADKLTQEPSDNVILARDLQSGWSFENERKSFKAMAAELINEAEKEMK